jgi:hypothetical protein
MQLWLVMAIHVHANTQKSRLPLGAWLLLALQDLWAAPGHAPKHFLPLALRPSMPISPINVHERVI